MQIIWSLEYNHFTALQRSPKALYTNTLKT